MSLLRVSPLAGLLSAALLLTGCFSEADKTPEKSADQRLRLAMLQPPRSGLTPLSDDAFKLSRWSTAETLVTLDKLGEAQPALAIRWQQIGNNSWRFALRAGVKFHDGSPLDAATVVNALTVAAHAAPKPRILDGVQLTAVADGALAVIVTTALPDPLLPQRLSSPQLAILSQKAYSASGVVDPRHTGSGPFELVQVNGTSSARLERFAGYWGEKAKASGIDVSFVPDGTARGAALRSGTADIVDPPDRRGADFTCGLRIAVFRVYRRGAFRLDNTAGRLAAAAAFRITDYPADCRPDADCAGRDGSHSALCRAT